jgi:N-acetyl sugar amidotransferase
MSQRAATECTRCVLDSRTPEISFDHEGICSYCRLFESRLTSPEFSEAERHKHFDRIVAKIREDGRGKKYDCVMGLSGGADSSYAALIATRAGIRPLIVHVDNGWNSELAVKNIECVVRGLNLDLITHVIDWEEFRGLQKSLLRASVIDLELVSDHAIVSSMFRAAQQHRIKYIVTGDNYATESTLPRGWNHRKSDWVNIQAINQAYERVTFKTFPHMGAIEQLVHSKLLRIEYVGILSYVRYVKSEAIEALKQALGWRAYGAKHFESIITRFYQGYLLPTKFGVDKRKFHFALLINSGQMSKEQALAELQKPPYDPALIAQDREYVCKKFAMTDHEFEQILQEPPRSHYAFASDQWQLDAALKANRLVRTAITSLRKRAGF